MTHFKFEQFWEGERVAHQAAFVATFTQLQNDFAKVLDVCVASIRADRKLLFFGNGGSASDAQHLATELVVRYKNDRPSIPAIALNTDTSALTAIGNDFGFDHLFARQIEGLGQKGDVVIAISTSGNSPNVLEALKIAKSRGLITVGLSGRDGGKMAALCDHMLIVPSEETARIQEMHIMLGHMLCAGIEQNLF